MHFQGGHIDDLILDSLRRRMQAMHSLYYDTVATMTVEHVNHVAGERVLPIASSLFHYTNMEDATFIVLAGEAPIWGWPGWPGPTASPASTGSSAGCTSSGCATWARSS